MTGSFLLKLWGERRMSPCGQSLGGRWSNLLERGGYLSTASASVDI